MDEWKSCAQCWGRCERAALASERISYRMLASQLGLDPFHA